MMKIIAFLFLFFAAISDSYGQNYLFQPKESGLYVSGMYGRGTAKYGLNTGELSLGYSFRGRLSIALNGTRRWNDRGEWPYNSISPSASLVLIQQKVAPFAISAEVEYAFANQTSLGRARTTIFGGAIFRRQRLNEKVFLIPTLSLVNWHGNPEGFSDFNMSVLKVQATLLMNRFAITPGITREASWQGDVSAWIPNVRIAYVVPIKKN